MILNGVDLQRFRPRPALRIKGKLLCVGRLCEQKGQDVLIQAFGMLGSKHPGLQLCLAGDGPWRERLSSQVRFMGLQDRVCFLGDTDPAKLYNEAEIVILPSRWEGGAYTLLEALASGSAIVATDVPGCEGLEDCCSIVSSYSPLAIANAISHLLESPGLAEAMRQKARSHAELNHDETESMKKHLELWDLIAQ